MRSPFVYLFACSLKNRVLGRLRRLREPKYAIGAVVGVLYFYLMFFRRARLRSRRSLAPIGTGAALPAAAIAGLHMAATFALCFVVLVRWFVPVSRQPLQVSAAERDFLLTAPVAHRRVVRYKLLRSLVGILFGTAIMVLFAWSAVRDTWSFLIGTFLLFTTIRLHLLGIALSRSSVFGLRARRDPAGAVAVAVVFVAAVSVLVALAPGIVYLQRTADLTGAFDVVNRAAAQPAVAVGLTPFTLMIRPVFAGWPGPFLVAALPAVALLLLNYRWVLRAEPMFEGVAETAEREVAAGRRAAPRPVYRGAPFTLALRGRPDTAVIWKNLILLGRYASLAMLIRVGVPLVVLALVAGTSSRSDVVASFLPIGIAVTLGLTFIGPHAFRNDLRQDLTRLSVLKTWPVSAQRLLWGEVLGSALAASLVVWLLMLVVGALSLGVPASALPWRDRLSFGVSAALLCPALILAQVVVQNAAVVLFPGWVAIGPNRPRGVEAMGQQMLMFAGSFLLLALGVLPGAIVGGVVLLLGYMLVGWLALVPAALILTALLVAEAIFAVHFLGGALDRMDPAAVEAAT